MRAQQTQIKSMRAAFPVTGPFGRSAGDFHCCGNAFGLLVSLKNLQRVLEGKSDRNIDMAYVIRRTADHHRFTRLFAFSCWAYPWLRKTSLRHCAPEFNAPSRAG
jgi:hypothetical protein